MGTGNDSQIVEQWLPRKQIDDAVAEIVHWFCEEWTPTGGLPPFELSGNGRPVGKMDLLGDLADYLPLLYLAGAQDYVRQQLRIAIHAFQKKHVIMTPRVRRGFLRFYPRANPFYSTDFLLGLVLLHRLDPKLVDLGRLVDVCYRIMRTFVRDGWMSKEVIYPFRWRLPISESDSLLFVEMLVDVYEKSGKFEFLASAKRLVRCWLKHPYTRTWGLVPQVAVLSPIWQDIQRFGDREVTACLYKHNTAMLAGLMALYRLGEDQKIMGEAILRLVDSIDEFLIDDDGRVYFQWVAGDTESRAYVISLGNAILIEMLLDVYEVFGRTQDLDTVCLIADYWKSLQNKHTGLVPESGEYPLSLMDHQTDFAVNLHRLYSVTGNQEYLRTAVGIVNAQLRYHRSESGYVNAVHVVTGEVIDPRIETRYSSLFLKPLLLLKSDHDVWADAHFRWVMKDR